MSLTAFLVCLVGACTGDDFTINQPPHDRDENTGGDFSNAAYNSTRDEFLVVFESDFATHGAQRVNPATGALIGPLAPVSSASDGSVPRVAYDSADDEYLAVWRGAGGVRGQRLNGLTAAEVGGDDFLISNVLPSAADEIAVAYNSVENEYLVTWGAVDHGNVTVAQRLEAATGNEIGADDAVVATQFGPTQSIAFNPSTNRYLVVSQTNNGGPALEVAALFLDGSTGAPVGSPFFVSGNGDTQSRFASVAYGATSNRFLVIWRTGEQASPDGIELFGQLLDGTTGAEVGPDDFAITTTGGAGSVLGARMANLAYAPAANQFLVSFQAEAAGANVYEVFAQSIDAATGSVLCPSPVLVGDRSPFGTPAYGANNAPAPGAAFAPTSNKHLVTWDVITFLEVGPGGPVFETDVQADLVGPGCAA